MAILKIRDNNTNQIVEIAALRGPAGVGITAVHIDEDGQLNVQYSNGTTATLGTVIGESAYETACRNGFEGTEQEWLDSLVPKVGENGTWVVEGQDTGVVADASAYTALSEDELNTLLN